MRIHYKFSLSFFQNVLDQKAQESATNLQNLFENYVLSDQHNLKAAKKGTVVVCRTFLPHISSTAHTKAINRPGGSALGNAFLRRSDIFPISTVPEISCNPEKKCFFIFLKKE